MTNFVNTRQHCIQPYIVISNATNRLATEKALQQHVITAAGNGFKHVRRFVAECALKST